MFSRSRWSRSRFVAFNLLSLSRDLHIFTQTKVFTGVVPFSEKSSREAMLAIIGDERPSRPTHPGLTDKLWKLTQRCWDQDIRRRPNAPWISCSLSVLFRNEVYIG